MKTTMALMLLGLAAANASAGYVATVGNGSAAPGGVAVIDVSIQSSGTVPLLDFYVLEVTLHPVGAAPAGGATFVSPQTIDFVHDASYVFNGRSNGLDRNVTNSSLTLTLLDQSSDGLGTDVHAPMLLARFSVAISPAAPVGARYTIDVANSQLLDPSNSDIPFTVNAGTLSVSAVPEPSAWLMTAIGAGLCIGRRIRERARWLRS